MKLGEMLVRDGCVTEAQLAQALDRQAEEGGRLGTILIEMGLIDADALTVYLGLELGIPIATGATLERAKRTAVRLLTPAEALHYRCIPLIVQDRQIIAALEDPHDMEALDELYHLTGYRVIPRVAPEIRIFYYLERYYGVPRSQRFAALGDSVRGRAPSRAAAERLPAPPLPGLPPRAAAPMPQPDMGPIAIASAPGKASRTETDGADAAAAANPASAAGDALTSEAEDLLSTLDADAADQAEEAPRARPEDTRMSRAEVAGEDEPEVYTPVGRDQTVAALDVAGRRGDVANALMCYGVGLFDVVALCVVRDEMAFGWKAVGPHLDRERIEALLIPLGAPSMFQRAVHKESLIYEPPLPATLHNYLYRVLRGEPPTRAMVAPISIGKRVVNFFYGHRVDRDELGEGELAELREVCGAAARAYVRLIATSKRGERKRSDTPRKPVKIIAIDDPS